MKRPRIYVDASVVGGCFDSEFATDSLALFDMAHRGQVALVISDLLVAEIEVAPERVGEFLASLSPDFTETVDTSDEAIVLHRAYLMAGIVGTSNENDALHVAIASVADCDIIVSWNFKHIVHFDKIRGYNAVNLREGYGAIAIHSPKEVV
jgi:predicted nucleic acid-binding protein